jgi:hypothetical protein
MTREARLVSGIILITVPTIQYGGYFLLTSLMNKGSGYMDNPLRQNCFRAGHAHAGVIVILSLVCQMLVDAAAAQPTTLGGPHRSATGCDSHFIGLLFLGVAADRYPTQWSGRADLLGRGGSRLFGGHTWGWVVAVSTELGLSRIGFD